MVFNSYYFLFLFLPVTLAGWYLFNKMQKFRLAQVFLIAVSLWFYGYANPAYLPLLLISAGGNFLISKGMAVLEKGRGNGLLFGAGLIFNLGLLFYFKYYDFFVENLNAALHTDFNLKNIVLPLGISFYTFSQIAFLTDRFRREREHEGLLDYLIFVTFFPYLISGPIAFHWEIIPQFQDRERRKFHGESFARGMVRFTLGLGKKVLLADTLAKAVNFAFSNSAGLDMAGAVAAAVFYSFELYLDFSGYCDMAAGIAQMLGITIPENFMSPYKSASVKEFWRRWHMTLGRFLTRYVYIPLGGSRKGKVRTIVNTMVVFLVSGIWHGANWTFVLWGCLHGAAVSVNSLYAGFKNKSAGKEGTKGKEAQSREKKGKITLRISQAATFLFVCLAFVFFRADCVSQGFEILKAMVTPGLNGSLTAMAQTMEPVEIYIITKALSMVLPGLIPVVDVAVMVLITVICIVVLAGKRAQLIAQEETLTSRFTWGLVIILVWSVLSFSGVSTFLYFNF